MYYSILCIGWACFLYTLVIFSEKIKGELQKWMVLLFIMAFSFDLIGTYLMSLKVEQWKWCVHSCSGLVALLIMGLHLGWAIMCIKFDGKYYTHFHRFSIWAWCIWMIAFFSGMPKH